jgi:hypothetical protein
MKRLIRENLVIILVLAAMFGSYAFLSTPGDNLASTDAFDDQVGSGTPTLVEFYSNT